MACTTQGEKAVIKEKGYKLKYLLTTIEIAKLTYYCEIKKVDAVKLRNIKVAKEIRIIFHENKQRYGVRRVHKELENRGIRVNHKLSLIHI